MPWRFESSVRREVTSRSCDTVPGRRVERVGPDGLHRVDHQRLGARLFHHPLDRREIALGEHQHFA